MDRLVITIAVPLHGDGKEEFWNCLERLRWFSAKHDIDTVRLKAKGSHIHHNRNLLVKMVQEEYPATFAILWLDSDMYFQPDLLVRLLTHNKPIVTTNAYRKGLPYAPVVTKKDKDGLLRTIHRDPDNTGLEPVNGGGLAATLTWLKVFDRIKFPWFDTLYIDPTPAMLKSDPPPNLVNGKLFIGEDVRFYQKAEKVGFTIYCDFSRKIGHIGDYTYDWRDYERNQSNNQNKS